METTTQTSARFTPSECWFDAPEPGSARFFFVYYQVSKALQLALRDELPRLLFADVSRYADFSFGYPFEVYRASRPCRALPSSDFTWDLLHPESMAKFYRMAERALPHVLAETSAALACAGLSELAQKYAPWNADRILKAARTQKLARKPLHQILVAESLLLHELLQFGGTSNVPARFRASRLAQFEKRWASLLRRVCRSFDFTAAGPALMEAVTNAFLEAQERWYQQEQEAAAA